jgi:hypothetical protein
LCVAALIASGAYADAKSPKPITVTIPVEAVNHMMEGVLPFEIPMGQNFSGALWIQTIEKLKIGKNSVTFFMRVLGKDIEFSTKIGSQVLNLKFGEANVSSNSEASFRYDKEKKLLFIIPRINEFIGAEKAGEAGEVLMPLLEGLSNIEYAVDLKKIEPLKGELQNEILLVYFDIVDIYSENNQFYVKIIPSTETTPKK